MTSPPIQKKPDASPPQLYTSTGDREQDFILIEFYKRYWSDLRAYILGTFGAGPPDPDDVTQQVFANFLAQENINEVRNPKAFLIRMAHNIVISHKRKTSTRKKNAAALTYEIETFNRDDITPERVIEQRERLQIIREAIHRMPRKRRRMLLLNRIHGLTYAEIARQFGVGPTCVKKHVARAIRDLDDALLRADEDKK